MIFSCKMNEIVIVSLVIRIDFGIRKSGTKRIVIEATKTNKFIINNSVPKKIKDNITEIMKLEEMTNSNK